MHDFMNSSRLVQIFFIFICGCLVVGVALFIAVDLLNLFDSRARITPYLTNQGFLFLYLYNQGGPIELLQWAVNAISLAVCLWLVRYHSNSKNQAGMYTFSLGVIGLSIMLLEDITDIRLIAVMIITRAVPHLNGHTAADHPVLYTVVTLSFYCLIGISMVLFLFHLAQSSKTSGVKYYIFMGILCYGLAAAGSATAMVGDWYLLVGSWMITPQINELENIFQATSTSFQHHPLGYWIMDMIFEESLELLGAASILAALLTHLKAEPPSRASQIKENKPST